MASAPSFSAEAARLIDGRAIAAGITARVSGEASRLQREAGVRPGLAVVLVGDDPASRFYVSGKGRKAEEIGFHSVQGLMALGSGGLFGLGLGQSRGAGGLFLPNASNDFIFAVIG